MALSDLPDVLGMEERGPGVQDTVCSGETSNMTGVGETSPNLSQDLPAMMTQSMCLPSGSPMAAAPDIMTSSTSSLQGNRKASGARNVTSQNWFTFEDESADNTEGRAESAAREREREEKVRRIRESQEEERRRKLEELKQHAASAQKFREQQEQQRRLHIDQLRSKDMDRRMQVEERRRDLEKAEQERREAILAKNKERESRLETQRRSSRGNIDFAFGSSAPRLVEPRVDSASGYWGARRSTSTTNVAPSAGRQSAEREAAGELRSKRTASAQGLDRSNEGEESGLSGGPNNSAHRRRTDLVPTLTMRREDGGTSGAGTPRRSPGRAVSMSRLEQLARPLRRPQHDGGAVQGARSMQHLAPPSTGLGPRGREGVLTNGGRARARTMGAPRTKQGLSRENSSSSRPGSSLSSRPSAGGVRLRPGSAGGRRPRPLSIATTGMTASMYEERQRPAAATPLRVRGPASTPKPDRMKRARSVTSDTGIEDDNRSTTSSQSVGPRTPNRRTPSQVKAEAAARKAKTPSSRPTPSTPKASLGGRKEGERREEVRSSKTPSPAASQDPVGGEESSGRQSTPDILKDNTKKVEEKKAEEKKSEEKKDEEKAEVGHNEEEAASPVVNGSKEHSPEVEETPNNEEVKEKKIITSEEEAKARIAEKRREMKEQKEREAEAERLRLEEQQRQEEEQRRREEEEMRQMEQLAEEGRRAEEERIQKAIQEREEEERKAKEEEERLRREKEESEKKSKEEAEKREVELQEKLKKEEEERNARKKRIEEIMARTRGKAANPPPREEAPSPQQPPSLDPLGDPTKPDLLGDITSTVEEQNLRNLHTPAEPEVEKGALDSLSLKGEDSSSSEHSSTLITVDNSTNLITMENGSSVPVKKSNGVVEGGSFDQILDLGDLGDSNKEERTQGMPSPIRAFEDAPQQGTTGALADLLS